MTADQVDAALRSKGFFLCSVAKLAPELGYLASSRSLKKPSDPGSGEGGFGVTPDLAQQALLAEHGIKAVGGDPFRRLEAAIDGLLKVL